MLGPLIPQFWTFDHGTLFLVHLVQHLLYEYILFQIVIQNGKEEEGVVHIRTADDHRAQIPCPIKYLHEVPP